MSMNPPALDRRPRMVRIRNITREDLVIPDVFLVPPNGDHMQATIEAGALLVMWRRDTGWRASLHVGEADTESWYS
jgi:hypothetical protein